ncbi:uncharacterized protein LOC113380443 [Ctenocephalides felis]|uniref:uncharacterized protein LOC113380443 n=1 Tax=Ctenocephalides felis TaxID=7515 RepID=UPI000E6E490D|nr:uncharacterized protein LOC113380443 [Ctenocephalides felis]
MAKILQTCKLIIWDKCTITHKRSLKALDRTLKDLRDNQNIFGGAMILLSGDFRQTLPVIPQSSVAEELNASLKSSNLWRHVKKLQLTTNMRVVLQQDETAKVFSKQLLNIGNDINQQFHDLNWLSERAILAAKNKDADDLNATIQSLLPGECFTYKSVDTATNQDDILNYPTEFLNSLKLPGLPPHNLQLKKTRFAHIGGHCPRVATVSLCKIIFIDVVAKEYSWAGSKGKKIFSVLLFVKLIKEIVVEMVFKEIKVSEAQVGDYNRGLLRHAQDRYTRNEEKTRRKD